MACSDRASVMCDAASDAADQHCGSHVAYPFFISFYTLCSFLVSHFLIPIVLCFYIARLLCFAWSITIFVTGVGAGLTPHVP